MTTRKETLSTVQYFLAFPLALFYMELVLKFYAFGFTFDRGILFTGLFSLVIGITAALLSAIWSPKTNRILSIALLSLITALFWIQTVYYRIFDTFATLYSATGAAKALQFGSSILAGILGALPVLLLLAAPLVLWICFGKRLQIPQPKWRLLLRILCIVIVAQAGTVFLILHTTAGVMSPGYLYRESFVPKLTVENFGLLTTTRLDAKTLILGESTTITAAETEESDIEEEAEEEKYADNVLEIDFDALIADESDETIKAMHEYFSQVTPTEQNEYTGMFEGKNLIWIVAEGFSSFALNEEKTPTLCKLASSGFVFTNFYNPIWNVSTSDGEYTTLLSLIPKSGVWSFYQSSKISLPFAFGNQLSSLGYFCQAFHDHDYDYYRRDLSHPNMGYDYKGLGNGLLVTRQWPESDVEMMEVTIPTYINEEPFHTYYMTVSGHLEYNFSGNCMALKHKDEVADLPYSEAARAYIACNMEFDQAMEYLLAELETAGVLEDTLIVISGDHYPYGLEVEEMEELAGHDIEENFEMFKSTLIVWSAAMEESITIDKACSALDVMPTVANLMGLDYDSRLFMGRDILSDSAGLVIFNNRSWLTDKGRYNSTTDTFTAAEGVTVDEDYAQKILAEVNNKFTYSAKILETDYYAKVLAGIKTEASATEETEEETQSEVNSWKQMLPSPFAE